MLLDFLPQAKITRAGCFKYEAVAGATANDLERPVPEEVKEERWHRFMAAQKKVSAEIMAQRVGRTVAVLIDEVDEEGAIGRTPWDAPEIDGSVFLNGDLGLKPGDMVTARITESDDYDLWAERTI
jgi:ribosomal protein S12 methylthiotransferase